MRRIQDPNLGPGSTYIGRDAGTNTPGTIIRRQWANDVQEELARFIESTGLAVETELYITGTGDRDQISKSVSDYVHRGAFYTAAGTDTLVLTPSSLMFEPDALKDGLVVRFDAPNPNTGASTLQVGSLAAKPIKTVSGVDTPAGYLGFGQTVARFDLANDWWVADRQEETGKIGNTNFIKQASGEVLCDGKDITSATSSATRTVVVALPVDSIDTDYYASGDLDAAIGGVTFISARSEGRTTTTVNLRFVSNTGASVAGTANVYWIAKYRWY